jgi:hypothetical protein
MKGTADKFMIATSPPPPFPPSYPGSGEQLMQFHELVCFHRMRVAEPGRDSHSFGESHFYPYSPVSNFVALALKGKRVRGEFVISLGSGLFVANPEVDYSHVLLESFNNLDMAPSRNIAAHTVADSLRLLFSNEKDFFQDKWIYGWHTRGFDDRSSVKNGWQETGTIPQLVYYDRYFLPTLIEAAAFNFEGWKSYPAQKKPKLFSAKNLMFGAFSNPLQEQFNYEKNKCFFLRIKPYRDSTIIMANYPTMSTFGQNGELLSVDLQFGWFAWTISGIVSLLSSDENVVVPTPAMKEEKNPYWSTVNQFRADGFPNLPHPTFESVLKEIESGV